jgi:hypothetical protein
MFEWHKKEKPVFTGISRGVGGFGFGKALTSVSASAALNTGGVSASGGAIYEYTDSGSTYRIHVFAYNSEPFVYTSGPGLIDVLVVGGGGAGGRTFGDQDTGKGGGGAGGVAWANQIPITAGTTCPITVGAGGLGSAQSPTGGSRPASVVHQSGSPSTFIIPSGPYTITGAGGGGGGVGDTSPNSIPSPNTNSGDPGGSGGGSAARGSADGNYNGGPATQPAQNPGMPWITNYGNAGGGSNGGGSGGGGGGGGAGGAANPTGGSEGTPGGPGTSTLGPLSASQTSAFLKAARIGTDPSNVQITPSSPSVSYIGGGGGAAPGTGGSNWSTPIGQWGVGGGGRSGAGRDVGQTGPTASLLPNAYWPEVRGMEHAGGGGGGAADDPTNYTTGSYAGSGGKGVVIVRYGVTGTSTGSFISATGGSVSTDGNFKVHTFSHPNSPATSSNTSQSFSVSSLSSAPIYNTIEVLCVGGGGSGGIWYGAGGGGGGVAHTYSYPLPGVGSVPLSIPIQIGGGGAAQPPSGQWVGNNGGSSYFGPVSLRWTGLGGGGGGYGGSPPGPAGGNPGGSGGGGGSNGNPGIAQGGRSTQRDVVNAANPNIVGYNYGNAGGNGAGPNNEGGGGGGAGSVGGNGVPSTGGTGGNGISISITGSPVTYGGGGGGAYQTGSSPGGTGGGGAGASPGSGGTPGTNGLGGGGGGAFSGSPGPSGQGGTGVVIVRYRYQ